MKKRLLHYAQQRHQRRMTIFYLLNHSSTYEAANNPPDQLELEGMSQAADRPRTAREMFADVEYDDSDDSRDD